MGLHLGAGVVLLLSVCILCPADEQGNTSEHVLPTATIPAEVTRVIDGDTLDARVEGNRVAVGYLGVRTPALSEPCGSTALERNRELAGSLVFLEEDSTHSVDATGRRLYYAFTADGHSIEEVLVREGLAWAERTDARHGPSLLELEVGARTAGRGCLWGTSSALP
jgi:endonuclease YncB( thermonuclease family)